MNPANSLKQADGVIIWQESSRTWNQNQTPVGEALEWRLGQGRGLGGWGKKRTMQTSLCSLLRFILSPLSGPQHLIPN